MKQDLRLITEAGFDAYVAKPISLRDFLDTVVRLLEARAP
jgi:CheY-like chemotaxis protein